MYEIGQLSGYEYVDTYATKQAEDIPTDIAHVATLRRRPHARDRGVVAGVELARRAPSRASARPRGARSRSRASRSSASIAGVNDASAVQRRVRPRRARPTRLRRCRRGTRRRARSSPGSRPGAPARRAGRPGTGTAGPSPTRRRRRASRPACVPLARVIASTTSAVWNAIASTTARARCARVVPRVMPTIVPRAYGSHHGEPSPVNAGTTYTPPVSGTDRRERPDLGRVGDDPEPVAQPLHRGAGDEDRAFHRVRDRRPAPSDHAIVVSSPSTGSGSVGADVGEHERAGAVRVLRHARLDARLAEQRGLLVAGDAAHRHREPGRVLGDGDAEPAARRQRPRAGTRAARRTARTARPTSRRAPMS